jgi:hypothetical protein
MSRRAASRCGVSDGPAESGPLEAALRLGGGADVQARGQYISVALDDLLDAIARAAAEFIYTLDELVGSRRRPRHRRLKACGGHRTRSQPAAHGC